MSVRAKVAWPRKLGSVVARTNGEPAGPGPANVRATGHPVPEQEPPEHEIHGPGVWEDRVEVPVGVERFPAQRSQIWIGRYWTSDDSGIVPARMKS